MQLISNDKTVRGFTIQDLKDFNSQSPCTQAKKKNMKFRHDAID